MVQSPFLINDELFDDYYDDDINIINNKQNNLHTKLPIIKEEKEYFDCGCCSNCMCDVNIECINCNCACNCDFFEDDFDYYSVNDNEHQNDNCKITINIIKGKMTEKKVRITLELNVIINENNVEQISVDIDIRKTTYLKIAKELL